MKKYTASIVALTTKPSDDEPIVLQAEAAYPLAAARTVADRLAKAHYGESGIARVSGTGEGTKFLAHIGEYAPRGVVKGITLRVAVEEEGAR